MTAILKWKQTQEQTEKKTVGLTQDKMAVQNSKFTKDNAKKTLKKENSL